MLCGGFARIRFEQQATLGGFDEVACGGKDKYNANASHGLFVGHRVSPVTQSHTGDVHHRDYTGIEQNILKVNVLTGAVSSGDLIDQPMCALICPHPLLETYIRRVCMK